MSEVTELRIAETAFQEASCVISRRGMPLKIDLVCFSVALIAFVEVIKPNFIECGTGGVGGDMSPEAIVFFVGLDDHGHGIPAQQIPQAFFVGEVSRVEAVIMAR